MTPTPGGQPKPQSSQQPGNEPGGANGMYGRFGQTPGQQPSQGFRQKVDGVRRGFGGRQQRGGMRQGNGMGQMQNNNAQGQAPQQDPVGYDGRPVQRQGGGMGPATANANARQADRSQDQGRQEYSKQLRSMGATGDNTYGEGAGPSSISGMGPATGNANARQADRSQDQGQASSYRTSGQYDRDRAGGMQDNDVAERETGFNSDPRHAQNAAMGNRRLAEQPMQDQPDYGRFAPGPAADAPSENMSARQRAAGNLFGGEGRTAFGNALARASQPYIQQPVQQSADYGRFAPGPAADAPSGDTSAQERAAANPFGGAGYGSGQYGSAFGAPPAQPEQPQAEDMQPRETFQTGQSSLRQPLPSLEGQSRRRQRDRFGYGA